MSYIYTLAGVGLIVLSLMSCTVAKTSINEIASLVMLLSGVLCLIAGDVLRGLDRVTDAVHAQKNASPPAS
jgi:hypothetical protein